MQISNEFWGTIGISIEDIIDTEKRLEDQICIRLKNKLNKIAEDYIPVIKYCYNIQGDSLLDVLTSLYTNSKQDFLHLYGLADFTENRISPEIIYGIASKKLKDDIFSKRITDETISPQAVLVLLFNHDFEIVREIYYEHMVHCASLKRYGCQPSITKLLDFNTITEKTMSDLLQLFEDNRPTKRRRPIKLWWFEKSDQMVRIVFRREKIGRSEFKLVERNVFQKTGDEKIFVFREGGNVLEMSSRREPKRTLGIAEFITSELTGEDIKFFKRINIFQPEKVDNFINRLLSGKVEGVSLVAIKIRNAPLVNSPVLEVQCADSIFPTVQDLIVNHKLDIVVQSSDILAIRIRIEDRDYNLKTRISKGQIEILFDNRNLRSSSKQELSQFLEKQIG